MAKQEGLGTTAPGQMKAFTKALSVAEGLPQQREKSLDKVLDKEIDIANTRKEALEGYFNLYFQKLESLKVTNERFLDDTFSVLNQKLTDRYKTLSSEIDKLEQQLGDISASNERPTARQQGHRKHKPENAAAGGLGKDTVQALQQFAKVWHSFQSNPSSNAGSSNNSTPATGGPANGGGNRGGGNTNFAVTPQPFQPAEQIVSDDVLGELEAPNIEDIVGTLGNWKEFFQKNEEERRNAILEGTELLNFGQKAIQDAYEQKHKEALEAQAQQKENIQNSMIALEVARMEKEAGLVDQITQLRLDSLQAAQDAELEAAKALNSFTAQILLSEQHAEEVGANRARESSAKDNQKTTQELEAKRIKWVEKQELEAKRRNGGILSKEEAARIQKESAAKFKLDEANLKKINEQRVKLEAAQAHAAERKELRDEIDTLKTAETFEERKQALYNLTHDEAGNFDGGKALSAAIAAISDLAKQLETKVDEIAGYKGDIDTRLQGSNNKRTILSGSYWDQLTKDMMSVGAITPFFKQEDFANNIKSLVDQGISFDIKQRAFLMTIQKKIATTFDVADGTLLRLIRIQQEDSTAGRLGMESALNSFLNEMYETSEYLSDVAGNVRSSLQEMEALMSGAEATEVEYQVQKWMGSLYSVGMSQEAVNSIASALGQIAAGQVEALSNGGAGNLMVMAANEAGLPISDILTNGLNAKETNKLLQATVNYLADLAESSKDNQVVQQQLANVFGVKASDLKAATNLATGNTINDIFGESLTYDNMLKQLYKMSSTMFMRTSMGEMMSNIWNNGQYSIASSMANNPISYLAYKLAGLLDSAVGGIDLPFVNVMGFGVDLNTTVSDLMRVAAVGNGLLGNLGPMISGLASSFDGQAMLSTMGIEKGSGLKVTPRGNGGGVGANDNGGGAQTTSGSGYVGNASGSDVKNSTLQDAEESKNQQMIEAKEEAETNQVDELNSYVIQIFELLDEVTSGKRSFNVKVAGYGLTRSGGAQGGVAGLLSNKAADNGLGINEAGGSASSNNSTNDSSSAFGKTSVSLGGWSVV